MKAASSSQSSLYSHHLPKSFRQHALSLFIKAELGKRGREREGWREGGREGGSVRLDVKERQSVSERSLAAERP